jgi:hypothetical protein
MADGLKARSFRLDDRTSEQFKQIAEGYDNQSQALAALISAHNLLTAGGSLPDRRSEIGLFTEHANRLVDLYTQSLAMAADTEAATARKLAEEAGESTRLASELAAAKSLVSALEAELAAAKADIGLARAEAEAERAERQGQAEALRGILAASEENLGQARRARDEAGDAEALRAELDGLRRAHEAEVLALRTAHLEEMRAVEAGYRASFLGGKTEGKGQGGKAGENTDQT